MFSTLAKSKTAAEKARRLSPLETELLDMAVTAAFLRPDSYLVLVDAAQCVVDTKTFEIFVIQIECAILSIVFAPSGRTAVLDFEITCPLLDDAALRPSA